MRNSDNLQRPPRSVPLFLSIQCVFGGMFAQVGWGILAFGMLFVLIFGAQLDLAKSYAFQSTLGETQGVVTGYKETSAEVNERTVVGYIFEYEVEGTAYSGKSYTSTLGWDNGESVTIEYVQDDPGLSRIKGTTVGVFGAWILLIILIFPTIGAIFALSGLRGGLKGRALLGRGDLALGTLTSKEPTNTSVNDQTVYALTFEFEAKSSGRTHTVVAKTHDTSKLEDEEQEQVLYLPSNPDNAVVVDALPGGAQIGSRGTFEGGGLFGAIGVLILPTASLALTVLSVLVMLPDA